MKFLIALILSLSLFALAPQAAAQKMSQATPTTLIAPTRVTADALSSAIDLLPYEGPVMIVLASEAAESGKTIDYTIHESTASGGSYTGVSGGSFTQVTSSAASTQTLVLNKDKVKRYIKLDINVSASFTGSGSAVSASIIGFKKYR